MLLKVADVAAQLRISRTLVYQLVESAKIRCHKIGTGRGTIRFTQADVDDYLARCRCETSERVASPAPRQRLKHLKL